MEEIEKLITETNIQEPYCVFVDDFITEVSTRIEDNLHSIYICGSIATGKAIPYESDADFTIVYKNIGKSDDIAIIENIKNGLLQRHPYITKIDTPSCSVDDVLKNIDGWGFWIKIISFCIYGDDLGNKIPAIYPKRSLSISLNVNILKHIDNAIDEIKNTNDGNKHRLCYKKILKKIIRSAFNLFIEEEGFWTEDIDICLLHIKKHYPKDKQLFTALYNKHKESMHEQKDMILVLEKYKSWYNREYSKIKN
jgi:hypothetical protein